MPTPSPTLKGPEWYQTFYKKDRPPDNLTPGQRDRDRILYTSSFRRLAGVSQVVSAGESHVFHNRLTHSLEVAQVARRLAEKLAREQNELAQRIGGVDADVAEAVALAHDLGHPPFGHAAEQELNQLGTPILPDAFEGNAQSFRIVTKLALRAPYNRELRAPETPGLNLSRATLCGLLKYPWLRGTGGKYEHKWGAYQTEAPLFKWARELFPSGDETKCVEAEIMDWADDTTYSVHDLEDFYRVGLVPLDRLRDAAERRRFFDATFSRSKSAAANSNYSRDALETAFEELISSIPINEPYFGSQEQRCNLRTFTAYLIARYINAISLRQPSQDDRRLVAIDPDRHKEVIMLKELTWYYVINRPALATQQHGQRTVIQSLFANFLSNAKRGNFALFPIAVRELLDKVRRDLDDEQRERELARIVIDLIAGMAEQQAVEMSLRLSGTSLGSALDYRLR
jgi:dGTPase